MFWIFWILLLEFHTKAEFNNTCKIEGKHLLVCEDKVSEHLDEIPVTIRALKLRDIQQYEIDLRVLLARFPNVESVSIYDGIINRIVPPAKDNRIRVLRLVKIGVENIGSRFLGNFPNLETLDLRGNYLQTLATSFYPPKLKTLYLSGNKWNCSLDLDWVHDMGANIIKDLDNLTCFENPHSKKSLLTIATYMKDMKTGCPSFCNCSLPKVVAKAMDSEQLIPHIEVNCSYRGLTELPQKLPKYSKIIHLEGNEIEDLKLLRSDPVYRKTLELYVDNNKIHSIEDLEGSYWLKYFRVFSISGNKLTEVPTYALENALEQNKNMPSAVRISLGGNPWRCDCVFTPVFQEMLQKFAYQIQDMNEIKCSYVEGDENSLLPIIEISRSSVCRSPSEYSIQALDLLNGILASLILLILGKLAYDYYYFKKTGRLPWIVTKMP